MSIIDVLKKYPEIELFSREKGYELHELILRLERDKSYWAYVVGLGIPVYSTLHLVSKIVTDICRIIDTLIQSIAQKEYAGGNIQSLLVDVVEYIRSICGVIAGAFVTFSHGPSDAADAFLTVAADPSKTYLTMDEGARLYSMGDRLHAFFVKHKIDYRISCGTALGAVREHGIIRNDDDIDLMLHPDCCAAFQTLFENGTFTRETGISVKTQPFTGGWQCFYDDSPKGNPNTPLEHIGKPFVDIFPGTRRLVGGQSIITYGNDNMYMQSKGDYFTDEEWGNPVEYRFGPTMMHGIAPLAMKDYLTRSYGPTVLTYVNRLYPHEVYAAIYEKPLHAFSIFSKHPAPRYMRHSVAAPLDYDPVVYENKRALSTLPIQPRQSNDMYRECNDYEAMDYQLAFSS